MRDAAPNSVRAWTYGQRCGSLCAANLAPKGLLLGW